MIETQVAIKDKVVKVYRDGKYAGLITPVRYDSPERGFMAIFNGTELGHGETIEDTLAKCFGDDPSENRD